MCLRKDKKIHPKLFQTFPGTRALWRLARAGDEPGTWQHRTVKEGDSWWGSTGAAASEVPHYIITFAEFTFPFICLCFPDSSFTSVFTQPDCDRHLILQMCLLQDTILGNFLSCRSGICMLEETPLKGQKNLKFKGGVSGWVRQGGL